MDVPRPLSALSHEVAGAVNEGKGREGGRLAQREEGERVPRREERKRSWRSNATGLGGMLTSLRTFERGCRHELGEEEGRKGGWLA